VDQVIMTQSPPRFFDEYTDRKLLADSVGLPEDQLLPDGLPAQVVSTAFPQLMVPSRSLRHLDKIELDLVAMRQVLATTRSDSFMIFTRECVHDESTVHARMFAPTVGVVEDPATGSASGALGAYLVRHNIVEADPTAHILVEQGYEMGRPSTIHVEVDCDEHGPSDVRVGGKAVEVASGTLRF
jgi:trans-2,3-dihydro-3-hydroxyanthranilate isomerase